MKLQEILDNKEIQKELDIHMRMNWKGIPVEFKANLDLLNPYAFQDLRKINIQGMNNYSDETITLKELNFLYLYCFVLDFHLFYQYEKAPEDKKDRFCFHLDLKTFRKFSRFVDQEELETFVFAYANELRNYINITGRNFIYLILD